QPPKRVERAVIMLKRLIIGALLAASSLSTGCLQKETSHTLYLPPDGAGEWIAWESARRSDEAEVGKRLIEEQAYIGPALLGAHGVARGLAALDPQAPVRTTRVRGRGAVLVL